jgi:aspartate aminotransferase/aminotransferase
MNGYSVTQGITPLIEKIHTDVARRFPGQERRSLVTSGTNGGLFLAMSALLDEGDEVVIPDPYFISYPNITRLLGAVPVFVDTYPDFRLDPDRVAAAITPRTKLVILGSPSNPTGTVTPPEHLRALAELCDRRGVVLMSDEIYRAFHYDGPACSPASFSPNVLVVEGFGKTYGVTGWRLGYAHGPAAIIEEMTKLQQFTFVCAPTPLQIGCSAAMDFDVSAIIDDYRAKRDRVAAGLRDCYELDAAGGAFYLFPKCPHGTGTEWAVEAIRRNLLIIPGNVFSQHDTHFRLSYAADDAVLERGIAILREMAQA